MTETEISIEERWRRIDALDLEPIVFKLTDGAESDEERLPLADADQAVALYRGFLKLCVRYPGQPMVPNKEIDAVWHAHFSDTAKYRDDCEYFAGRPLDHWPYAGTMGAADEQRLKDNFTATRRLFLDHFGVDLLAGETCAAEVKCECEQAVQTQRPRPRPNRPTTMAAS